MRLAASCACFVARLLLRNTGMRGITLFILLVLSLSLGALAKPTPLTVKEICLMLRSGYSADVIEKDLATRHFIEAIDASAEKALVQSGASAAFIAGLKDGRYAVPAGEIAAVQQEMEAKARRRAAMEEDARKSNTLYQDQLAKTRATSKAPAASGSFAAIIKGDLVTSRNGILQTFNDQALERKKLIGLYFAARWCPSCRKFTPELVEYYNRVSAAHPEFEVVFVSNDRSAPAMEAYMHDAQMPWPAVSFDKIAEKQALLQYAGPGIPCLVVIDAQGNVVSNSYDGSNYRGPQRVLADLDQFFTGGAPAAIPRRR